MASTTLSVTVNGGVAPFSIQVNFYKDGNLLMHFAATSSFTHLFTGIDDGSEYDITIGGFNPAGGNTVCDLSTDEISLSFLSDPTPSTTTGIGYRVDFKFIKI